MATIATLLVNMSGDLTGLSKTLAGASKKLENFGSVATAIGGVMSKALTAPLVAFAGASVRAFGIQEDAERKLAAAIRATGGEVDANMTRFKAFASQLQSVTRIGDETTLRILQIATAQGLSADSAERATRNAIAMQAAFGVSADSAIRMTAALEQGDATMLRRYIPALRSVEDETMLVAKAQEILTGAFTLAEAEAQTSTGRIIQLKNSLGDLMEEIGGIVANALTPFVEKLQQVVKTFQSLDESTKKNIVRIGALVAAGGPVLLAVGAFSKLTATVIALNVAMMANPYLALGVGLLALGTYAAYAAAQSRMLTQQFQENQAAMFRFNGTMEDHNRLVARLNDLNHLLDESGQARKTMSAEMIKRYQDEREAIAILIRANMDLIQSREREAAALERVNRAQAEAAQRAQTTSNALRELALANRFLNDSMADGESARFYREVMEAAESAAERIQGLDLSGNLILEKILPPNSVGDLRNRIAQLEDAMRFETTPGNVSAIRDEVKLLQGQLDELTGNTMPKVSVAFEVLQPITDRFVNSFGDGMANVVLQGEKLSDTLRNIGRLLASAAIQQGIKLLLSGGLSSAGSGFFGSGGGLLGAIFGGITGSPVAGTLGQVQVSGQLVAQGSQLIAVIENSKPVFR